MQMGMLLSDVPAEVPPQQQFSDLLRTVEAAQRNGFTYIAIGQHFLYGDLRWLQPVPLLARLAAEVDPHVRLVTQIIIPTLYHPVILAEELATLDIVTEGRLIVGVGLGYRLDEFDYLGIPRERRGARLDESIRLMQQVWTADEINFDGEFWTVQGGRPHIRPVQQPHPPLWVGAHGMAGVRRAGRFADKYATHPETTREQIAERFAVIKEEFAKRGKPFGPQSLRRNVLVADTKEEAIVEYARVAKGRYITYAQRGLDLYTGDQLEDDFYSTVSDHAVLGSPDDVARVILFCASDLAMLMTGSTVLVDGGADSIG